jgi:LysM repeat protein
MPNHFEIWFNCTNSLTADYGCADVASGAYISVDQLTTWNTWLKSDCDNALFANLNDSDTRAVCIGVNGTSSSATATATATSKTGSSTVSSASQGPTQSGEVSGCLQHYTVKSGDSCSAVDSQFGITFQQFYSWNPSVGDNCQYLGIGNSYCVKGPASTASSTKTSTSISTTTSAAPGPTQSGEVKNCLQHYTVKSGDSCSAIDSQFGITFQQFYSWNPSVGNDCQYLQIGSSYCVKA